MSITNPKRPFCINTKDAKKTRMRGKKTRSRRELKMVQFDKSQRSYQNFTDRIKFKATLTMIVHWITFCTTAKLNPMMIYVLYKVMPYKQNFKTFVDT